MDQITTPDSLGTDGDGAPLQWRNHYSCHECGHKWTDDWSCQVDDECPECGEGNVSPYESKNLLEEWEQAQAMAEEAAEEQRRALVEMSFGEGW